MHARIKEPHSGGRRERNHLSVHILWLSQLINSEQCRRSVARYCLSPAVIFMQADGARVLKKAVHGQLVFVAINHQSPTLHTVERPMQ